MDESKHCKYCRNEINYRELFLSFWFCDKVHTFWEKVGEICNSITLRPKDSVLGNCEMENSSEVQLAMNHVILIAKMCTSIGKFTYNAYLNLILLFEMGVNMRKL